MALARGYAMVCHQLALAFSDFSIKSFFVQKWEKYLPGDPFI